MSRNRHIPRQQKNQLGQWLCRMPGCGKLVGKGRRSYCSGQCRYAFSVAYFASSTRWHAFKRDAGICAICGCDTEKLHRILKFVRPRMDAQKVARELGFANGWYSRGHFWQADHIQECVRGGWGTGLDNIRTLCTPCHKAETARLAAELAAERRSKKFADGLFSEVA